MTVKDDFYAYPAIDIFDSPLGPMLLGANENCLGCCLFIRQKSHVPARYRTIIGNEKSLHLELAMEFLKVYFSGTPVETSNYISRGLVFDLEHFTGRERRVYDALIGVQWGETISYKDLAARAGAPNGARFIGNVMAKNRFPVLIPCHRIIKSDGKIGQYTGGSDKKEFMLKLEASTKNH